MAEAAHAVLRGETHFRAGRSLSHGWRGAAPRRTRTVSRGERCGTDGSGAAGGRGASETALTSEEVVKVEGGRKGGGRGKKKRGGRGGIKRGEKKKKAST